ncbi:NADH-quinone oxidoreductase subunit M [Leptolyngbya sp. FACHB-261]|uniref:NADH-quinone oxidoreductase subunit M n=1 Tax=Leptolyngbya sp. FACHB-261 TaxID=2692806 RepID=UPI00168771E4|nr:NADH-quinone oxidoreductase subunit M [Leptolyngbya sp. FACHB-261]MBD2100464.1 NADH-quinone oxidoreductase subunit M [Leptolyngbya sp. FACHB-261]
MLSTLVWLPILGAAVVGLIPNSTQVSTKAARWLALAIATGLVIWTLLLMSRFDPSSSGLQFQEALPWLESLGLTYSLGVDGLSLPLLALSSLLTWIVIYRGDANLERPRLFYAMTFLANAGIAGAFMAQNLLLFFLFYELELIPLYLLIAIWGGAKREYAATKFLLYTAVSGVLILVASLGLTWLTGASTFDYAAVQGHTLSLDKQLILLVLFVVGFGIKIPLVPFHTWLPDAYVEASTPVAILLGGILAKLGTYGLLRFGMGLLPDAWGTLAPSLAVWGTVSVLYGALTAIAQKDIKRMVAYSSVGHMGYVLLASAALTPLSLVGAVSQMVSHGLILALLFHLVGVIETKVGTRELDVLNGLMSPIRGLPLTAALLVLGGMASAGIPGLVGFISEFLVFQGSYSVFPGLTLLCIVGSGLTAVYFVIMLNRTCFGRLDNAHAYYPQVQFSENLPSLILVALIIFLGIQPTWLVRWSEPIAAALVANVPVISSEQVARNLDFSPQAISAALTPDLRGSESHFSKLSSDSQQAL